MSFLYPHGVSTGVRDTLSTIASIEEMTNDKGYHTLRVKQHDRPQALTLLAKISGMLITSKRLAGRAAGRLRSITPLITGRASALDSTPSRRGFPHQRSNRSSTLAPIITEFVATV
jgi:hypothetical protein